MALGVAALAAVTIGHKIREAIPIIVNSRLTGSQHSSATHTDTARSNIVLPRSVMN